MAKRFRSGMAAAGLAAIAAGLAGAASAAEPPAPVTSQASIPAEQQQRPNVLIWMLDDVGFAQLSCFGGLVATPNIDRIARSGLRYSNYHTAAICSASRAAILSPQNA